MNNEALISARILTLVSNGIALRDAINTVLGEGTFENLASDIYDGLRK